VQAAECRMEDPRDVHLRAADAFPDVALDAILFEAEPDDLAFTVVE
jgi:hypothetical protein